MPTTSAASLPVLSVEVAHASPAQRRSTLGATTPSWQRSLTSRMSFAITAAAWILRRLKQIEASAMKVFPPCRPSASSSPSGPSLRSLLRQRHPLTMFAICHGGSYWRRITLFKNRTRAQNAVEENLVMVGYHAVPARARTHWVFAR